MLISLLSFIVSALLLYFSSHSLLNRLIRLFTSLTNSQSTGLNLLFFLLLPGVFLHEFSHILMAEILQVRTGELSLKPHFNQNQLHFGSAQIQKVDPLRLTLIGTAPFVTGLSTIWLLLTFGLKIDLGNFSLHSFSSIFTLPSLSLLAFAYLIFTIANTMFSSPSDLQAAGLPIIFLLILFTTFQLANLHLPPTLIPTLTGFFFLLSLIFSLTFIFNLILLIPLQIFSRLQLPS